MSVRIDAYKIAHVVHHRTLAVHNGAVFFESQIGHLFYVGITIQKFMKGDFTFAGNDVVDAVQLKNGLPFVTDLGAAQQNFNLRIAGFHLSSHLQRLRNVPDVTTECEHIIVCTGISYFFGALTDGELFPEQTGVLLIQLIQQAYG